MSETYSLIEIFGKLPVHPNEFDKLDKRLKHLGKPIEGNNFCIMCGTLSPAVPRDHHQECAYHSDKDSFEHLTDKNPLGDCPECGSEWLSVESSREMCVSRIFCSDCCFTYSDEVDEDTLQENYMKRYQYV